MHRLLLLVPLLVTFNSYGQTIDAAFAPILAGPSEVRAMVKQTDEKTIIAGDFVAVDGEHVQGGMVRLNADGTRDLTFNVGTGANGSIYDLVLQADGKILVSGVFTSFNGFSSVYIVRLESNGDVDLTFQRGPWLSWNHGIRKMVLQTDGKILAFNPILSLGSPGKLIMRLTSTGEIDDSFAPTFQGGVKAVVIQPDNKIVIGGSFNQVNGEPASRLARLNFDGSLDVSFMQNLGTGMNGDVNGLALQSNNDIIAVGWFTMVNSAVENFNRVARIHPDGIVDNTFEDNANYNNGNSVNDVTIQSDDKILIGGTFQTPRKRIARLDANGTLDATFNVGTGLEMVNTIPDVMDIRVQADGQVIVAGRFTNYNGTSRLSLMRLSSTGTMDASFTPDPAGPTTIYDAKVLPSGDMLVAGDFIFVNGESLSHIVQLNPDGTTDPSFQLSGVTLMNGMAKAIGIQSDGKIIVGGSFSYNDGASRKGLARLLSSGAYDGTFQGKPHYIASGQGVHALHIMDNDQIIIGGEFVSINGVTLTNFARLNADGTFDGTFNSANEYPAGIWNIDVRASDGKMILSQLPVSQEYFQISLANANGTRVNEFDIRSKFTEGNYIHDAIFLSDGKILIGGDFKKFDGQPASRLIKVDDNGVRDTSFPNPTYPDNHVFDLFLDNGKVFVGKSASSVVNGNYVDIMDESGNLFPEQLEFVGSSVSGIAKTGNSYLLWGRFTNAGGILTSSIAKLDVPAAPTGDPTLLTATAGGDPKRIDLSWTDNSSTESAFEVQRSPIDETNFITIGFTGADITTYSDQTNIFGGTTYFYRVKAVTLGGESAYSNHASVVGPPDPPSAPSNLTGASATHNTITLTWLDNSSNETGFQIYRSPPGGDSYQLVGSVGENITTYVDEGLPPATSYWYKMRAVNAGGSSVYSNPTGKATTVTPPAPPSNLQVTARTSNSITVNWNDNSNDETSFTLYMSTDDNTNYVGVGSIPTGNGTTIVKSFLTPSSRYFFKVTAVNSGVNSAFSEEIDAYTLPATPTNVVATPSSISKIKLQWTDNSANEIGFRIYRQEEEANVLLVDVPANTQEYVLTVAPNSQLYYYVTTVGSEDESSPSNSVMASPTQVSYGDWSLTQPISGAPARSDGIAVVVDGKAFIGLGQNSNGVLKDFWQFDTTGTWTKKADFPGTARIGAVAFSINGIAYVGTGNDFSGSMERDFYAYDHLTNSWSPVADLPPDFASGGGITSGAAFSIGSFGYVGLGNTGVNNPTAFFMYDPATNTWTPKANFPAAGRISAIGFASNTKGYFALGSGGLSPHRNDMWEYDPMSDQWTQKLSLDGNGRSGASVFVLNNADAYAVCGDEGSFSSSVSTNKVNSFFMPNNSWSQFPSVAGGSPRRGAVAFSLYGKGFVFGGDNGVTYFDDLMTYFPAAFFLPTSPSPASATHVSPTSVRVQWTDIANEDNYQLKVSIDQGAFQDVVTLPENTTEYLHEGLAENKTYQYQVVSKNIYGSISALTGSVTTEPIPGTPTNLVGEAISPNSISLNWTDNSTNEIAVYVYMSTNGIDFSTIANLGPNATSVQLNALSPFTEYSFKLKCIGISAVSEYSNTIVVKTKDNIPTSPSQFNVTSFSLTHIALSWVDNSNNETGFMVRRQAGSGSFELIKTTGVNETTYVDEDVTPGVNYFYTLSAVNSGGESGTIGKLFSLPDPAVIPTAPTSLEPINTSQTHVELQWNDNSNNELGFKVFKKVANGTFIPLTETSADVSSFTDETITPGTLYAYRVLAFNDAGESAVAELNNFTVAFTAPAAPTNLQAIVMDDFKVQLTWTDNSNNETAFEIERDDKSQMPYASVGANELSFLDPFVIGEITYRVRAKNDGFVSDFSNPATVNILVTAIKPTDVITLSAYPNPVDHSLTLFNAFDKPMVVRMINSIGIDIGIETVQGRSEKIVDTENWSTGVYILKVEGLKPVRVIKK